MSLTGTLRPDGEYYHLVQQLTQAEIDHGWSAARIFRLTGTPITAPQLDAGLDQLVHVTGYPEYREERHRMYVVVEHIELLPTSAVRN